MALTATAKRQRDISDLLRVTTPSELERWLEVEARGARQVHHTLSPWVERVKMMRSMVLAFEKDDDRMLAFARLGAEKAIDAVASAMSVSAMSPLLMVGRGYLDVLFTTLEVTVSLERAEKELKKAQSMATSVPKEIEKQLVRYRDSSPMLKNFSAVGEAYLVGLWLLKGYMDTKTIKENPKIVLGELFKLRGKFSEVEKASDGINQLLALRILLGQTKAAIKMSFSRYHAMNVSVRNRGGFLAPLWRSFADISYNKNEIESLHEYGKETGSGQWMISPIDDLATVVEQSLVAWLRVDQGLRNGIVKLDLFSQLRN